ncbi:MAG TPA: glycosyltransferase family 4 protein [Mycobacteriales bacterium]|nr:glycosyltransferase family 4 protein [Mycobacteriales bacterium]
MRILHISSLWTPFLLGGAEVYSTTLAQEQRAAGHSVGVVTLGVPGEDVVEVVPAWPHRRDLFAGQPAWKKAMFRLEDVYNPVAAKRMSQAIDRFEPDIVHTHAVMGLSTAALTAGASRVPHVHHLHDHWLLCRRTTLTKPSGAPCNDRRCRAIAAVRKQIVQRNPPELLLAFSRASARAHESLQWTAGRVRHLPHTIGVEFEGRKPVAAAPGAPVTFGFLGQLLRHKGLHTLLEAFAGLSGGHRLLVAGDGELAESVAAAGPNVVALGQVNGAEKDQFFAEVDCLVVPSQVPETGPLVVLEARAHGLPVIGARIGGIPDIVAARCAPLLVQPGSASDLRAALERFIAAPEIYSPPADGPPERIGRTWRDHADDVSGFYEEAIQIRRKSAGR